MPLSVWYRPVVRLGGRTAVGIVRVIHCDWGIPACCVIGRLHGGMKAGEEPTWTCDIGLLCDWAVTLRLG